MGEPFEPPDGGNRYLGSGLSRSGDLGMVVRAAGRGLEAVVVALVRGARYVYDGVRLLRSRRRG